MTTRATSFGLACLLLAAAGSAGAKLPPLNDEATAKAAEAAARAAWANNLANFQLCQSMDRVAAAYFEQAKKAGKAVGPAATTPPCSDPGAFVYPPPAAAATATPAVATAPAAAPAKK